MIAIKLRKWLGEKSDMLCAATLARTPNLLPDENDLNVFVAMLAENVGDAPVNQLLAVQFWALTGVGHDAPLAHDWLTILRVLKEEIVNQLAREFQPKEVLDFWRLLDDILTYALIEATQLSVDVERADLLEHTIQIRRQMERLEETKNNFIAVAAHELKTPLTILEGNQTGNQSSVENGSTFDEQCESRRANEINNFIMNGLVKWIYDHGMIKAKADDLEVEWDSLIEPSPSEKIDAAMKMIEGNAKALGTGMVYFTVEEIRERAGYEGVPKQSDSIRQEDVEPME